MKAAISDLNEPVEKVKSKGWKKNTIYSVISILFIGVFLTYYGWDFKHLKDPSYWWKDKQTLKNWWLNIGDVAVVFGIVSFVIWGIKTMFTNMKKDKVKDVKEVVSNTYKFLSKYHIFVGIITLVLGLAHSIYFIIRPPGNIVHFIEGMASMVGLFSVSAVGIIFHFKSVNPKVARFWHIVAALLFVIGTGFHIAVAELSDYLGTLLR